MRKVVYISDENIHEEMRKLGVIGNRSEVVDELVRSYGLLDYCKIVSSKKCSSDDLLSFHSSDYVDCLQRYNDEDDIEEVTDDLLEYGLAYDCPMIEKIYNFTTSVAGSTLAAVDAILEGTSIAINWNGGWHHAQRNKAAGFCYVNDIVIGIHRLRTKFQKVLYLDLDVHHGDGVEDAFSFSKYVMTVSFHQREAGYFPGTGAVTDIGFGPGKGYTINAPYLRDVTGEIFVPYFNQIATVAYSAFKPDVCIVQCGGDVIVGDHLGGTNLLPEDLLKCVQKVLGWNLPTVFLGGGGYNIINTAKYWTQLTALIVDVKISRDIPENDFFLKFGPDFTLDMYRTNIKERNTREDLSKNVFIVIGNLKNYIVNMA
ncbi:histone deacetylase 8-like isoform X2 [Ochlerotatus camptorhynchus]|uniref:histone deacetylase 8-like isoform X2 n=1 Tax=Ochlerotatus camptorhynchus TaxID=644619 RepID=UPI0031DBD430